MEQLRVWDVSVTYLVDFCRFISSRKKSQKSPFMKVRPSDLSQNVLIDGGGGGLLHERGTALGIAMAEHSNDD